MRAGDGAPSRLHYAWIVVAVSLMTLLVAAGIRLFWHYALRGLSLLFLPYAFDFSLWGLSLFGFFYGLDWIATVPPTVKLTANAFGAENAGLMYGWITVTHQLGSAAAAYDSGLVRAVFGARRLHCRGPSVLCRGALGVACRHALARRRSAVFAPAGG